MSSVLSDVGRPQSLHFSTGPARRARAEEVDGGYQGLGLRGLGVRGLGVRGLGVGG